jgi:ankyrin repeat protein
MIPLHWACDHSADTAILYQLAWITKSKNIKLLNSQRSDGKTPLHLAIIKAGETGNTGAIKELLICGADRDIKDLLGKKPYDYIGEIQIPAVKDKL